MARSYPNLGTLHTWPRHFTEFAVGVDLYQAGTHYKLVERSVKYGVLFIGLTFLAFIVFEMGLGARLHPVQYGIVGLSMVVFYLVLLSLSEHLAFLTSYLSASGCIVLMVSCYVGFALRNYKEGIGIAYCSWPCTRCCTRSCRWRIMPCSWARPCCSSCLPPHGGFPQPCEGEQVIWYE